MFWAASWDANSLLVLLFSSGTLNSEAFSVVEG